jgi:hypothetical protein
VVNIAKLPNVPADIERHSEAAKFRQPRRLKAETESWPYFSALETVA